MDDQDAIRQAALDYAEGWYRGVPEQMARSLHQSLVKRAVKRNSASAEYLISLTKDDMVSATRNGGGTHVSPDARIYEVTILDQYEEIATAKVANPDWIDYLHLVRIDGVWQIANVLYTKNRQGP